MIENEILGSGIIQPQPLSYQRRFPNAVVISRQPSFLGAFSIVLSAPLLAWAVVTAIVWRARELGIQVPGVLFIYVILLTAAFGRFIVGALALSTGLALFEILRGHIAVD